MLALSAYTMRWFLLFLLLALPATADQAILLSQEGIRPETVHAMPGETITFLSISGLHTLNGGGLKRVVGVGEFLQATFDEGIYTIEDRLSGYGVNITVGTPQIPQENIVYYTSHRAPKKTLYEEYQEEQEGPLRSVRKVMRDDQKEGVDEREDDVGDGCG